MSVFGPRRLGAEASCTAGPGVPGRPRIATAFPGSPRYVPAGVSSTGGGRGARQGSVTGPVSACPHQARDRGSVTAETAVALPGLVLLFAAALWAVSLAGAQIACVDAARLGARAAARGEPPAAVRAAAARAAPPGASIRVRRGPDLTRVTVDARVASRLGIVMPVVRLEARAIAATEPAPAQPW